MKTIARMFVYMLVAATPVAYGCNAPPAEDQGVPLRMRILIPEDMGMFNLDSMHERFRAVCEYLNAHPDAELRVIGHTDERGTSELNLLRSRGYADQVARALRSQSCNAGQMQVMGYGEERPIEAAETPEARAKNRRVEIELRLREN